MWRRVWVWKRKGRDVSSYCLRWHDDSGRICTESVGRDRKLAEQLWHKRESELNAGELRSVRPIRHEEFVEQEVQTATGRLAPASVANLEHTLKSFGEQEEAEMLNNLRRGFQGIVRRAGIKRCTFHDLRRTFASHLAMAHFNQAVVQRLAGHASITATLRYYTGIMPEALRSAQGRLPFVHVLRDISNTCHGGVGGEGTKMSRHNQSGDKDLGHAAVAQLDRASDF